MKTKFTIDYFIRKFTKLRSNQIGRGGLENKCALWHCGVRVNRALDYSKTPEAVALSRLLCEAQDIVYCPRKWDSNVFSVNDDASNPRSAILSLLRKLKAKSKT